MKRFLFAAVVLAFISSRCFTQEQPLPSLQEQLDDLKSGQQRILQELELLRAALPNLPVRSEQPSRPQAPKVLNVHGEPFKGAKEATVAIVEYSDFDCSHCAEYARDTYPKIDQKYVQSGKVKYFFRDFPEPGNAESLLKARLARCAGEQGKFWEAHDYLFAASPTLVGRDLHPAAEALGLDYPKLMQCLQQEKYEVLIQRNVAAATRLGFAGTPTFVMGQLTDHGDIVRIKEILLGSENFASFEKSLEALLAPPAQEAKPASEK